MEVHENAGEQNIFFSSSFSPFVFSDILHFLFERNLDRRRTLCKSRKKTLLSIFSHPLQVSLKICRARRASQGTAWKCHPFVPSPHADATSRLASSLFPCHAQLFGCPPSIRLVWECWWGQQYPRRCAWLQIRPWHITCMAGRRHGTAVLCSLVL